MTDQEIAWRAELLRDMASDDIGRGEFKSAEMEGASGPGGHHLAARRAAERS